MIEMPDAIEINGCKCLACGSILDIESSADETCPDCINSEVINVIIYACPDCPDIFEDLSEYEQHYENAHIVCDECGEEFKTQEELDAHIEEEHPEKFTCEECDEEFDTEEELEAHMQQEHPNICDICEQEFGTEEELEAHIEEEHPFECEECDDRFDTEEELEAHMQQEHPILCDECGEEFETQEELDAHIEEEHPEKFECEECDEEFDTEEELEAHTQQEHPILCDECDEEFKTQEELAAHMMEEHDGEEEEVSLTKAAEVLAAWRASFTCKNPLVQRLVVEYPEWLLENFGDKIEISLPRKHRLKVKVVNPTFVDKLDIIGFWFNPQRELYTEISYLTPEEVETLRQALSKTARFREVSRGNRHYHRFYVMNEDDYKLVQEMTGRVIERQSKPSTTAKVDKKLAQANPLTLADAAFTILNEAEGKTASIRDILDKAKERDLIDKQVTATELASALTRDNTRFIKLGSDNWKILDARSIDLKTPVQVAFAIYRLGNGAKLQEYYLTTSNFKLDYQPDPALIIAPGVSLLLASPDGSILPLRAKVIAIDSSSGSLEVESQKYFNRVVSQAEVAQIIGQPLEQQLMAMTQSQYEEIVKRIGGEQMTEQQLLDYIVRYITNSGYYFDKETIYNYHICLKTRPFVILAGLSGTGKSKLAQLYAQALGSTVENGRYLRLAVRPGWNDDRYLLGYLNTLTGEYETEPAVDFLLQAEADPTNLYFMCLDEMNLAHVEHYFSQFLSALEEDKPENRIIPLIGKSAWKRLVAQHGHDQLAVPQQASIPANLLFIGTINVDETTQMLSDKVIDRANTIEFFEVDLDKIPEPKALPELVELSSVAWSSYQSRQLDKAYHNQIIEIGKILNKADLGLGYRVLKDIELYLANSKGLLDTKVAFDLQMKQRILPRVRGSDTETTRKLLEELVNFTKQQQLPRSQKRLEEMQRRLKRDGYTGFWR